MTTTQNEKPGGESVPATEPTLQDGLALPGVVLTNMMTKHAQADKQLPPGPELNSDEARLVQLLYKRSARILKERGFLPPQAACRAGKAPQVPDMNPGDTYNMDEAEGPGCNAAQH